MLLGRILCYKCYGVIRPMPCMGYVTVCRNVVCVIMNCCGELASASAAMLGCVAHIFMSHGKISNSVL